jgi:hypothetical protein
MGSVTHPDRAQDTVELAKIAFGDRYMDPGSGKPNTVIVSLINVNSPMTYDATMLGALKVYGAREPGLHRDALYSGGRHVAGHCGRHGEPNAGRSARGHGVHSTAESGRAPGVR